MNMPARPKSDPFAIREQPVAAPGWQPGDDPREVLESDMRSLLRQMAEAKFEQSEAGEHRDKAEEKKLLALLAVQDAFENVFHSIGAKQDLVTPQMKKWIGNFRTVYLLLRDFLASQGVARIENPGGGFDPNWHHASETVEDPARPDGTIVEEIRPGYVWRSKVIRKADVKVVRNDEVTGGTPWAE